MSGDNGWQGFSNIRLEGRHRDAIKKLAESATAEDLIRYIDRCLLTGYKVTISPDFENDAIIVSLTGVATSDNDGWTMSQRHRSLDVAILASQFAHSELAGEGSWENATYDWQDVNW